MYHLQECLPILVVSIILHSMWRLPEYRSECFGFQTDITPSNCLCQLSGDWRLRSPPIYCHSIIFWPLSYDKKYTLKVLIIPVLCYDFRAMDTIKRRCSSYEGIQEKRPTFIHFQLMAAILSLIGDNFSIRPNIVPYELLNNMAVVQLRNIQRLRLLGLVFWMEDNVLM